MRIYAADAWKPLGVPLLLCGLLSAAEFSSRPSHLVVCRVEIVSEAFSGQRQVKRHQMVYQLLDEEIQAGVHALSMSTTAPDETK